MSENEIINGPDNPLWMAWSGVSHKPKLKDVIVLTAISVLPVVMAVLMQKPALRQAIKMRVFHDVRIAFQATADVCQDIATKAAMEYQKAKL
jgi:hypothetical protein